MKNTLEFEFARDIWLLYTKELDWTARVAEAERLEAKYGTHNRHMHEIILIVLEALGEKDERQNV